MGNVKIDEQLQKSLKVVYHGMIDVILVKYGTEK
jgi:hypothetical protein